MSRRAIVQSQTDVGDRLLCLLKSDTPIHNPLRLLSRDSERVINVHRDVMQASSGFFRKLLESDENLEDNPIKFPVSANVLDIVIEFLYTRNAVLVDTGRLVELLVLADLLELDSLKSELTAYFDSNIVDCLNTQDFLTDQPVAVVEDFIRLTSAPTCEHHRLRLIYAVHAWAKQNSVEASRIGKLVGDLLDKVPPSEPSAANAQVPCTDSLKDLSVKLSIKSGRVYASVCNRVYVLAEEGLCLLCRTTMQIDRLSIIKHDARTLQLYYTTEKDHVRVVTCNRQNNETTEKPISMRGVHIAGLDTEQQVIWTARNQLVLMFPSGDYRFPIGSQPFSHKPTSIACDGCRLYMKLAGAILIVDVLTGMKVTHPTGIEGSIIIWEKD